MAIGQVCAPFCHVGVGQDLTGLDEEPNLDFFPRLDEGEVREETGLTPPPPRLFLGAFAATAGRKAQTTYVIR